MHSVSQHLKLIPDSHVNKLSVQWDTAWILCVCDMICSCTYKKKKETKNLRVPATYNPFVWNHYFLIQKLLLKVWLIKQTIQEIMESSKSLYLSFNSRAYLYT